MQESWAGADAVADEEAVNYVPLILAAVEAEVGVKPDMSQSVARLLVIPLHNTKDRKETEGQGR